MLPEPSDSLPGVFRGTPTAPGTPVGAGRGRWNWGWGWGWDDGYGYGYGYGSVVTLAGSSIQSPMTQA